MTSPQTMPIDHRLVAHCARQRLVVTLTAIAVASGDLALTAGPLVGLAVLAGASLLATAGFRVVSMSSRIVAPRDQAIAVFACGLASVLVAPVWVAAIDPESGLTWVPWQHVGVLACVWPAIAAAIAFQWLALERERSGLDVVGRVSGSGLEAKALSGSGLGAAIAVVTAGLLTAAGEALLAADRFDLDARRGAAMFVLHAAAVIVLVRLAVRVCVRRMALVAEWSRLEAGVAVVRELSDSASAVEPLEQRLATVRPLLDAFELERDRQASEHARVAEAARALGPGASAGMDGAGELVDRIERCRRHTQFVRVAGGAPADPAGDFAHRVETAARGLVSLDHASRAVFDRMSRIVGASKESSTSLGELVDAMRSVDGVATSIHELSNSLVSRAELGRARFDQSVAGMEAIRSATQSAETIIRGLDARTREIGGILDVIDEVGDQTSLLALNAAIIAAQAGEHGRAFSVVAEEIRDLADRVLVSTKEIGGLIQAVQTESERAIGAIEAGSQSVRAGVGLAAEVGRTLEEITHGAHAASAQVAAVASSVLEQSRILDRAVELAGRVDEAVLAIESADVDRIRSHAAVAETMIGLRDAAAGLRTLLADQTAGFARIDGELGGALDSARDLTATIEKHARTGAGVVRLVEAGSERIRAIGSIGAELVAAHEAVRFESGALRARAGRTEIQTLRSSDSARAGGEGS